MNKFLILIFLNSIFVWSQDKQSDLNKYFLKGKVKSIHSITYEAIEINDSLIVKGEKKVKNKRFYGITDINISFNEFGFITELKDNYRHEKNIYNCENNILFTFHIDSNLNISRKIVFKYNSNKKIVKEIWYTSENKNDYKIIFIYRKGKLIKQIDKDLREKYYYLSKYQYDNNGNINKIEEFENDSLTFCNIYQNDSLGRKLKIETYGFGYKLKEIVNNVYNKSGNLTEIVKYNTDNKIISKIVYSYDIEGHLIEENEFIEDPKKYKQYNLKGDEILSVNEYIQDFIVVYSYTYDNNNNWTKKITYYNGKPYEIEEREILYY
jgi:hypothetical protein